ncbi:MAG: serine O-acetyltransferase [Fastidiosipilaceae bacterium]|jgi:serine O-acetyltransferase
MSKKWKDAWLSDMVKRLTDSYGRNPDLMETDTAYLPDVTKVIDLTLALRDILFPGFFSDKSVNIETAPYYIGNHLIQIREELSEQIKLALCHNIRSGATDIVCRGEQDQSELASDIVDRFLEKLPDIQDTLTTDVHAAYDGDPAAKSYPEVILSYPGMLAITIHRLAHQLYLLRTPLIPRMMSEYAHGVTGIDIHPGAQIGPYFFIDHGTGVVIGETTVIGRHAKIYQGVTLGALSTGAGQKLRSVKRHPTLGDRVTVYGGATILGGDTFIGSNVVIGGNVFITRSVEHSTKVIMNNPELTFHNQGERDSKERTEDRPSRA